MSQKTTAPLPELLDPPAEGPEMNHGRTVAGWVLFWAACVGAVIIAVGAVQYNWVTIGAGVGLVVVGLVLSGILRAMGHGQPVKKKTPPTVEDL